MPNVPTVAEVVGADFEEDVWIGAVIPAKSPTAAVSQTIKWMSEALSTQEIRSKLVPHGLNAAGACGTEFGKFLAEQVGEYGRVITGAGMKAD